MTEILTRREANKARTREAVAGALRALLQDRPVHEITVDQLSEAAGISRRTFFNYYAGLPAVLIEVFSEYAADLLSHLDRDQLEDGPVQAMRAIVRPSVLPREFLGWLAVLNCHDVDDTAAAGEVADRYRRERTQQAVADLVEALTDHPTIVAIEDASLMLPS